ncbi:MAG: PIN domain-containing protein [Candidatus Woesearchaeota archaeon]
MELVLDANVLISSLIKDSHMQHFLLLSGNSFYTPEYVFEEIAEHIGEIKEKTSLSGAEINDLLKQIILLGNIKIIPLDELAEYKSEAMKISPDADDAAYIALALKLKCAICSKDKALKEKQAAIRVLTPEEIMRVR